MIPSLSAFRKSYSISSCLLDFLVTRDVELQVDSGVLLLSLKKALESVYKTVNTTTVTVYSQSKIYVGFHLI